MRWDALGATVDRSRGGCRGRAARQRRGQGCVDWQKAPIVPPQYAALYPKRMVPVTSETRKVLSAVAFFVVVWIGIDQHRFWTCKSSASFFSLTEITSAFVTFVGLSVFAHALLTDLPGSVKGELLVRTLFGALGLWLAYAPLKAICNL
jgi:hypothetical protein